MSEKSRFSHHKLGLLCESPLDFFLEEGLRIRRTFYGRDTHAGTLTVDFADRYADFRRLCEDYLEFCTKQHAHGFGSDQPEWIEWSNRARLTGLLPVGKFADTSLETIRLVVNKTLVDVSQSTPVPLLGKKFRSDLDLSIGEKLEMEIERFSSPVIKSISFDHAHFSRNRFAFAVQLLHLSAIGIMLPEVAHFSPKAKLSTEISRRSVVLEAAIDQKEALRRLNELVRLARIAEKTPFPMFGLKKSQLRQQTSSSVLKEQFESFIADEGYVTTSEFSVYGMEPQFDSVFSSSGSWNVFWQEVDDLVSISHKSKGRYVVS